MSNGPYETEAEVLSLPDVRAAYSALRMQEVNRLALSNALHAAGVNLGSYDLSVLDWLTNWEPQTCAVIAAWITRAGQHEQVR